MANGSGYNFTEQRSDDSVTKGTGNYKTDIPKEVAQLINSLSLARLFLILSFIVYGIVAFSKRESGINPKDLAIFIVFSGITITFFLILTILRNIYRINFWYFSSSVNLEQIGFLLFKKHITMSRRSWIVIFLLYIAILMLVFKSFFISSLENIIQKIISFN